MVAHREVDILVVAMAVVRKVLDGQVITVAVEMHPVSLWHKQVRISESTSQHTIWRRQHRGRGPNPEMCIAVWGGTEVRVMAARRLLATGAADRV